MGVMCFFLWDRGDISYGSDETVLMGVRRKLLWEWGATVLFGVRRQSLWE